MIYLLHSSEVRFDRSISGGWETFEYQEFKFDTRQVKQLPVIVFGYTGQDFRLKNWVSNQTRNVCSTWDCKSKEDLWSVHKTYHSSGYKAASQLSKELGGNYCGLVCKAQKFKKIDHIFIIYLSKYDRPGAEIYKDYLTWFLAQ